MVTETRGRINTVALRETMDAVLAASADGLWDQVRWISPKSCGTAACFAGHRALQDGFVLPGFDRSDEDIVVNPRTGEELYYVLSGQAAEGHHVAEYARQRFGLTESEADWLFDSANSLDTLKEIVDDLCSGRYS